MNDTPTPSPTGYDALQEAAASIRTRLALGTAGNAPTPRCAFVLGSGLGELSAHVAGARRLAYSEIPHMPTGKVEGHAGEMVLGTLNALPVVMLSGRAHYYEGFHMGEVVFGVRLCRLLGADTVVLTNAAGGLDPDMRPGDLMLIRDHIHLLTGENPLRGPNESRLGTRFPDMTDLYTRSLRHRARELATELGLEPKSGVYACVPGPSYETPAEIRMLRTLGADAVGMSTTAEAIAARHMGMRVLGISCITNLAAGIGVGELNHDEVKEVANRSGAGLQKLAAAVAAELAAESVERA